MAYRCKKYLSLILTIALINSSIQPLYASFPEQEDEVVRKAGVQARLDVLEEKLQNQLSSSATVIAGWTPSFIENAASKIGSWFESTFKDLPSSYFAKSPLEIDYGRDRAYWLAHFSSAVDEIKDGGYSNNALHARLVKLQDMVFTGSFSPYVYEKGLQEIEALGQGNQTLFESTREDFKKALKTAPEFINQTFRHEASLYIHDLHAGRGDTEEFMSCIRYYRDIDNALDYKDTLTSIRSSLREHKKNLKITNKEYDALIAALNTELGRIAKDEKKRLQANQAFSVAASSELPYYNQEWGEIHQPTNNAIAEPSKEKGVLEDALDTSSKALRKLVHTGAKYVQEHPTQALMMALAGQVAAAAAYQTFTGPKPAKGTTGQANGQDSSFEEETAPLTPVMLERAAKRNVGDEFQINQNTAYRQLSPKVTGLSNGNAFVVWYGGQSGDWDIYGRLFSVSGTALSNEFTINQNTTNQQFAPKVAGLSGGNAFVVWYGGQSGDWDIYGRLFSANGTALSNEFTINQNTAYRQHTPEVTGLSDGNAFVVWQGGQSGDWDIYGRLFSANGTALSNDFIINQNTTQGQFSPKVTSLSDGNAFVVWKGDWDVYGRLFSANGTALNNDFTINQNTTHNHFPPKVTGRAVS